MSITTAEYGELATAALANSAAVADAFTVLARALDSRGEDELAAKCRALAKEQQQVLDAFRNAQQAVATMN